VAANGICYGRWNPPLVNTPEADADTILRELADLPTAAGPAANPYYLTTQADGSASFELRTLFAREMIANGVLMPWLAFSYRHGEAELAQTSQALDFAFAVCSTALRNGLEEALANENIIKPVFRQHN
jgi:glutamate-1-semialdehyde 2,1-aminomutase